MAIEEQMEFIFGKGRTIERRTGVMRAEYRKGCPQRDGVENEGYVGARSVGTLESKERDGAKNLLERILDRDNQTEPTSKSSATTERRESTA
ncbi:hypothetical protein WGM54_19105 [Paenibacillus polymyxa]|uniref:hypothetical protein n=1 Tax=Paenibacillus polymyxa TaxID=1406 RepID=UPI00307D3F38